MRLPAAALLLFSAYLSAWPLPASAQDAEKAGAPLVLSPDAAAELALENSIDLQIDAQTVEEAEGQLRQALALTNLKADLTGSWTRRGPEPNLPPEFSGFFLKSIHTETLTLTKPLWTWGSQRAVREAARVGVDAARSNAGTTKLALARLARQSVLYLLFDERLLDVDMRTLAGLLEHQRVTQKRYREGLIAFFEMVQADAQVSSQEKAIAERKSTIARSEVALRQVLRLDQNTPISASVAGMPERPDMDLRESIEYALETRPEMKQAALGLRLAEASLQVTRTSDRPTVSVQGALQDQTSGFGSTPLSYSITLAFQKTIIDGGTKKGALRESRARLRSAELEVERLSEVIAAEVADQYVQIEHHLERIRAADTQELSALEQLRIARLRYEADIGLGREVIDAQSAVAAAQTDRANAQLDLYLAIVGLRSAMGMLDLQEATE